MTRRDGGQAFARRGALGGAFGRRSGRVQLAIGGRCGVEAALEELDEVRDIREGALGTHLRDGLRGREEEYLRAVEALGDKPLVGRGVEAAAKLLLEGGERAVGQAGELLDRDVIEEVCLDDLRELFAHSVGAVEQLAAQTALLAREYEVYQLVELDALPYVVVLEASFVERAVDAREEVADGGRGDHSYEVARSTGVAAVARGVGDAIRRVEPEDYTLQGGGRGVEHNLLEGARRADDVLLVVVPRLVDKYAALVDGRAVVVAVDELTAAHDVSDSHTRQRDGADAVVLVFGDFHDIRRCRLPV